MSDQQTNQAKPGVKTTEFWIAISGVVVTLLLGANVIGEGESGTWQSLLVDVLPGAAAIVAYIWSRTKVKTS